MKKLLLVVIFFGLQSYAQKTFEVYNYTSLNFEIYDIVTNASGNYPEFRSKPFGTITIAPGGSYKLVNTGSVSRFPFHSPSSTPYISTWLRVNPPNPAVLIASNPAWSLGNPQVFSSMTFGEPNVSYEVISTTTPIINGGTWTAIYDMYVNPTNPNIINYTIVIF